MSALDHYSHDSEKKNRTKTCDCGAAKNRHHEACERCTFLDGTRGTGQIIDALRGTDGLSASEVSRLLGNQYAEGTARSLRRLWVLGRVRRYRREASAAGGVSRWGAGVQGQGAWVYALDARTT